MINIILKGNPRSTGTIYKTMCRGNFPRTYLTNDGKSLKEDYQWQAKIQYKGQLLTEEVGVHIRIYFGNKRKNDWDNFHKLSMDALTGIVWEDDSLITMAIVEKLYDKANPRIEITIT